MTLLIHLSFTRNVILNNIELRHHEKREGVDHRRMLVQGQGLWWKSMNNFWWINMERMSLCILPLVTLSYGKKHVAGLKMEDYSVLLGQRIHVLQERVYLLRQVQALICRGCQAPLRWKDPPTN